MEQIAMVLLMGGNSTRMGTSKGELVWEGKAFAEKIAGELSLCGPVYLSLSEDTPHSTLQEKYPCIVDSENHIGPIGGISAVLHQISEDSCFVCACDMPFMSAAYVNQIRKLWHNFHQDIPEDLTARSGNVVDALLVKGKDGRIYTTAGIYRKSILPNIDKQIYQGNYRLRDLLEISKVSFIDELSLGILRKSLININTMEEFIKYDPTQNKTDPAE
ncbi:MAG: molybdenum cofactor guanylyltransferase [Clostridiales bacterium]|nr:molybdenum cofactor guanylyltransferase [Clostridiales bacterium]